MAEKCNRCICVDCVKIGHTSMLSGMRINVAHGVSWRIYHHGQCKYFSAATGSEPVIIGEETR